MECSCCAELDRDLYNDISAVVLEHHENINGTGYPAGKKGDEINYYARVVAIIDFYDAVTSYRSYHDPLAPSEAIKLMSKSVNKKIDKDLFEKFKDCVGEVLVHGNRNIQLPSDFDPCQPHDVLPFEKVEPEKIEEDIFDKKKKGVA